jgi:hypothetical protein
MSRSTPVSPRQEALDAILSVRGDFPDATIGADTWEKLVAISWDSRSQSGDRRDIQREIRRVLLESTRAQGA